MQDRYALPTVKQYLSAIQALLDHLIVGHVLPANPAAPVRGLKHIVKQGKTPVFSLSEARDLLDSIDLKKPSGLRDRALLATMVYSFARVGAMVGMNVEDYYQQGKRWWLRLHEKGGRFHRVPAHHNAEAYLEVAGIWNEKGTPLWRSMTRDRTFIRTPGTALPRYTERCHEGAQLAAGLQRKAAARKTATTIVIRNMRATWAPKPTRDHTTSRPRPA